MPASVMNAPSCTRHGSEVMRRLMAMSGAPLLLRIRGLARLDTRQLHANRELDEVGRRLPVLGPFGRCELAVDDLDGLLDQGVGAQVADEIGERDEGGAAALYRDGAAVLTELGQPEHVGHAAA